MALSAFIIWCKGHHYPFPELFHPPKQNPVPIKEELAIPFPDPQPLASKFYFLSEYDYKEMATHSSILAWKIPWTEGPGGLQAMGSQRVGHSLATIPQQQGITCKWNPTVFIFLCLVSFT